MTGILNSISKYLLRLPRNVKRLLVILVDVFLCVMTIWFASFMCLGEFKLYLNEFLLLFVIALLFSLPTFFFLGLYQTIFRYSNLSVLVTLLKASIIYGFLFAVIFTVIGVDGVPKTIGLIQPLLFFFAIGASRVFACYWLGRQYQSNVSQKLIPKVLIYGCGTAGRQLATVISATNKMIVSGFLDDDVRLQGNTVNGIKVYDPACSQELCQSLGINEILLALPGISRRQRNIILNRVMQTKVVVRSLPNLMDIASGKVKASDLNELDEDDLLGRNIVTPDLNLLSLHVSANTVMVTGAGGSIGSELCQQILRLGPTDLLLLEQSEYALYQIHQKLLLILKNMSTMGHDVSKIKLVPLLGSVEDTNRMRKIIHKWKPHIIYHAAAYKHVPLVELNPIEGIQNNVFGTLTVAMAAGQEGVRNFVLISTDKAVRPTNIMGASKRLAEMILQAIASNFPNTRFSMVRFGNVLGSSGSVVPKFRQQIKEGGPIHLTHPEVTRFFMTISEAAQLVMQAGAIARGGEVFILNMGKPVKILDLVRRMVELSGLSLKDDLNPDGDIEIEIIGLRPGEKLYEELLISNNPESTIHPLIMKASEEFLPWLELSKKLEMIRTAIVDDNLNGIKTLLKELVSGYIPDK